MKKTIIFCIILGILTICIILLFHYFSYTEQTKRASIVLDESQKFSKSEVESAAKCVYEYFLDTDEMYLKKLWYDEELSNETIKSYMANSTKLINIDEANVIVLYTNHHKGKNYITGPNMNYNKYAWILVEDSETGEWCIVDSGLD